MPLSYFCEVKSMNDMDRIELLRKRNQELNKELDAAVKKIKDSEQENSEKQVEVKVLIEDLESIKTEWIATLKELKQYRDEYAVLITELKEMKSILMESKKLHRKKLFRKKE